MNILDEIPFKVPLGSLDGPLDEVELVNALALTIPDQQKILQETQYEFSLENWVLTGVQESPWESRTGQPCPLSKPRPSCPPYWLMFSSPQESRLARRSSSDLWEPPPRQRSRSLTSADGRYLHPRVKFLISDSEGEDGYSEDDEGSSTDGDREHRHQARAAREFRHSSSPHLQRQPSPGRPVRHRKVTQPPLPLLPTLEQPRGGSPQVAGQRHHKRKLQLLGHVSRRQSLTPQPPCSSPPSCRPPPRPSTAEHIPSIRSHKPTVPSLSRYSRLPPPPSLAQARGSHAVLSDSSDELLSAMSQDERDLLETITEQGYSLRTAIVALQKTGRQSPEKVLRYLLACDRLCRLGYDETQVEEALEMFQNCEAKAAEFLHLLSQFNEMGFQQNAIKEVLLVHENHRERALEELMARVA